MTASCSAAGRARAQPASLQTLPLPLTSSLLRAAAAAAAAGSSLFIWVATRQLDGLYKNCWLVEYVTPIKDPAVIKALQIGY
jgi:hypothetical protein